MFIAVADTHTVLWYLYSDSRLSSRARQFVEEATRLNNIILISSITLVEIVYLIEKNRIAADSMEAVLAVLNDPASVFEEYPVDLSVAQALARIDRNQIPDMPDRIIAATALHLGVPVISRDGRITGSDITSIW
jgi:PIN domain nuclease of toxin-antitoxin system